jgi:lipopolysaccharide export system permease protein
LTRQVVATLVMAVVVFTFVLLLGNVLKEILLLLVNGQANLGMVLKAVALLIPFVLVFALPMGMLTATLLVFGRFSADQELTAARANGVSLIALITPVLLLSVALSGVCGFFNLLVSPQCRMAYRDLRDQIILQKPTSMLTEGRFLSDFRDYLIYVGKVRGNELEDILVASLEQGQIVARYRATGGRLIMAETNHPMTLRLTNGWAVLCDSTNGVWQEGYFTNTDLTNIIYQSSSDTNRRINYSDMTFAQLCAEKKSLERLSFLKRPIEKHGSEELHKELELFAQVRGDLLMPVTVQIHRQVAFSFACIGFTMVGIPLGIRTHRRETSVGIAIAIVLVLIYYSFIILAQSLDTRTDLAPHLIVWLPNFIFQAIGAVMLWRANRGG